ncbi:hypothetical protein AALA24_06620 [Anaerovoracaceae bacterium 42-11]|nr:hypothetical protein [Emergencia sp.]
MGFKFFEKNRIVIGSAVLCCIIMVMNPEVTAAASKEAINLWLNSVVPMLLPFFIAANFLKHTGVVNRISPSIYPFVMGVLSGYPMGARVAGDYYREGMIDNRQLYRILSYSMITGPAFLVGAVGVEFLHSHGLGVLLAVCHYVSALINSLFYGGLTGKDSALRRKTFIRQDTYYNILTDAMIDSFRAIAIILAYIIIFMIGTDLLQFSGILNFLPTAEAAALAKGFLEMTVGCNSLAMCQCTPLVKTTLAAFVVTFGGLSVMGQSMSMLRGCNVTFRQLFVMKLSHGVICAILTFAFGSFMVY